MTRVKEGLILTPNQKFPLKINYGEIWVRGPRNVRGARTLGVRGLVRGGLDHRALHPFNILSLSS